MVFAMHTNTFKNLKTKLFLQNRPFSSPSVIASATFLLLLQATKKHPLKLFWHLLATTSNHRKFCSKILHVNYLFSNTYQCQRAFHYP